MKLTKEWVYAIIIFIVFGFTVPVFDDPNHKEGKVTLFTWAYRTIYKATHGVYKVEYTPNDVEALKKAIDKL